MTGQMKRAIGKEKVESGIIEWVAQIIIAEVKHD